MSQSVDVKKFDTKEDVSPSLGDSGVSISEAFSENEPDVKAVITPKKVRKNAARNKECHICVRTFKNGTDLRRHLLIHTNEKPHECEICKKSYRQEVNLNNHIIMVHTNKRQFKCQFCRKPFGLKTQLKHHLRIHTGEKPYSCPICEMRFAQAGQLEKHMDAAHGHREKKCCELCFTKFKSERNLRVHMERHKEGPVIVCQICRKKFKNDIVLKSHLKMSHGLVRPECQICELMVEGDMHDHMKTHLPKKPVECEFCNARFSSKTQYAVHKRTHTGEKPYQCRVCWQSFGHKNVLIRHVRKHTGEKPFPCVLCSSTTFSQLCHLKTHMRTIHYKDKTYVCEGCKESFKVMFQLERHKEFCDKTDPPTEFDDFEREQRRKDAMLLTRLRYLVAVLLKKISTEEKLSELGFDKRLIDHVLIASLKVANRKCYQSKKMDELDRMKLNIQEFLEWIVPANILDVFKKDCESIEIILDMIVTMNLKEPIII